MGPTLLLIINDDAIINDEISNAPTNLFTILLIWSTEFSKSVILKLILALPSDILLNASTALLGILEASLKKEYADNTNSSSFISLIKSILFFPLTKDVITDIISNCGSTSAITPSKITKPLKSIASSLGNCMLLFLTIENISSNNTAIFIFLRDVFKYVVNK